MLPRNFVETIMAVPAGYCIALAADWLRCSCKDRNRAANLSQFSVVFKHGGGVFTLYLYSKYSGQNLHRSIGHISIWSDYASSHIFSISQFWIPLLLSYSGPSTASLYTPHNVQPGAAINQCPSSGLISCYPWNYFLTITMLNSMFWFEFWVKIRKCI